MTFETWRAFLAASTVFLIFPVGPTILLVITLGLSNGPRVAPVAASGVAVRDFTAMTVSLAGSMSPFGDHCNGPVLRGKDTPSNGMASEVF